MAGRYLDFIFINRFGQAQHQATLNKAIRRIIRDCNDEQFEKSEEPEVLLPHFSCHSLRHTFTTRMCEAGVNIKVIQDALGHTDISTTRQRAYNPFRKVCSLYLYTFIMGFGLPVDFQAVDEYNKYQWRITGFHSSTYIKFTSIDAKLSANKKKSHN